MPSLCQPNAKKCPNITICCKGQLTEEIILTEEKRGGRCTAAVNVLKCTMRVTLADQRAAGAQHKPAHGKCGSVGGVTWLALVLSPSVSSSQETSTDWQLTVAGSVSGARQRRGRTSGGAVRTPAGSGEAGFAAGQGRCTARAVVIHNPTKRSSQFFLKCADRWGRATTEVLAGHCWC